MTAFPATAALAVVTGKQASGFACLLPGGQFMSGEYRNRWEFVDAVEGLLGNGLVWAVYAPETDCRMLGALELLCQRTGSELRPVAEVPDRPSDASLRTIGFWRQGMARANNAARLLAIYERPRYEDREDDCT